MLTGSKLGQFVIGPKIGYGAFGEIYVIRIPQENKILAMKVEPLTNQKNILELEANVMRRLNPCPYFPRFKAFGRNSQYSWLAMELLGPSLSTVVKRLPDNHLSISTGLRVAEHVLLGLEALHEKGFIHRDVKPSNILLRRSREYPIAIIDFGLSRMYIDRKTGKHLPPRSHPGFRGTAVYASPNAHMHQDLSRRDDLISWFYLIIDVIAGPLPWKKLENRAEILHMKRRISITSLAEPISPQLVVAWEHISSLSYYDTPNYDLLRELLHEACQENHVKDTDEWDWHPLILQMDAPNDSYCEDRNESSCESEATAGEASGYNDYRPKRYYNMNQPLLDNNADELGCCCCYV